MKPSKLPEFQTPITLENIPITKQEIKKNEARPKTGVPISVDKQTTNETIPVTELVSVQEYVSSPPPSKSEIFDFFAVEKQPQLLPGGQVQPVYPELARKAGQEGSVLVEVVIGTNGLVDTAYVVQSRPKGVFDEFAVRAAYKWKFSPAYQRDKPVKVRMQIPFRFTLRE